MKVTLKEVVVPSYYKKQDSADGYLTLKNLLGETGSVQVKATPEQARPILEAGAGVDGVNLDCDLVYVDKVFGKTAFTEVRISAIRSCKPAKVTVS